MIIRLLNPLKEHSYFILGARGTGKTTFLHENYNFNNVLSFNLLEPKIYDDLMLDPDLLKRQILHKDNKDKIIVVDEVQKLPKLLDLVHDLIVKEKKVFILTGSSARRLKQVSSNLLAGRAYVYPLFPFSAFELGENFELIKSLERGLLPESYLALSDEHSQEYLRSYVLTYVQKEIQLEQWVRKIEPFRFFLEIAAQMSGKIINRASIGNEVGVDDMTIKSYFEILEDTHLGFVIPAFHTSVRKAQKMAPKFYFFDNGVKRALDRTLVSKLVPQTSAFGEAFEHFILMELIKISSYKRLDWKISYARSKDDVEVDFIIDRPGKPRALIEVKSKNKIIEKDAKSLETLGHDLDKKAQKYILSLDKNNQIIGETNAVFWKDGLRELTEN